ncbi:hypothetical protein RvY_18714 [Ramazzottius varieornatus]|uniref:Uncharacterized protein n=1 Tax=Ramazzottius varieornatus TaxID=947166 RepID=A0A1D1W9T4_RAMVA|nr:hypothetical protein RvY_18714 [Ramazzottius varieornatus]
MSKGHPTGQSIADRLSFQKDALCELLQGEITLPLIMLN